MSTSEIVLHIWPARWNLPTIDPSCLAAVMYLQQAIPGKFTVAECNNPDLSPTGQLPFLVHEQHVVSSLGPVIKYVAGLKAENTVTSPNLDASLNSMEKSQTIAWRTHVEYNLGDIVSNVLYSRHNNWVGLTHHALASMYPLPQRYYVPGRIRQAYRARLEASGLWDLDTVDEKESKPFQVTRKKKEDNRKAFQQAFGREKVLEKARTALDIYTRLLGERDFIYSDRPTTLDIILAGHVLLLLDPPFPDPFVQNLIKDSYPTLASHARRVHSYAFGALGSPVPLHVSPAEGFTWRSMVPWPPATRRPNKQTDEDIHFMRMRWGFYGVTLGSLAVYIVAAYFMARHDLQRIHERIQAGQSEEADEEEADEDDEREEDEEEKKVLAYVT